MNEPTPLDIREFLKLAETPYDWLIPGLLERGDRVIFTGGEGRGKSTLLRQIALKAASGLHPFDDIELDKPLHVLLVDFENSDRQSARKFGAMLEDRDVPAGHLTIICYNRGMNLTEPSQALRLANMIAETAPDLLIIGPTYKMGDNLETEQGSAALAFKLDEWRTVMRFALIMESHQPHEQVVDQKLNRPERPYGSSLWRRWPEFGMCLENDGRLRPWRGPRDERDWPERLRRGEPEMGEWPWEVDDDNCAVCGLPKGRSGPTCSAKCSNTYRQRQYRARHRTKF